MPSMTGHSGYFKFCEIYFIMGNILIRTIYLSVFQRAHHNPLGEGTISWGLCSALLLQENESFLLHNSFCGTFIHIYLYIYIYSIYYNQVQSYDIA